MAEFFSNIRAKLYTDATLAWRTTGLQAKQTKLFSRELGFFRHNTHVHWLIHGHMTSKRQFFSANNSTPELTCLTPEVQSAMLPTKAEMLTIVAREQRVKKKKNYKFLEQKKNCQGRGHYCNTPLPSLKVPRF